MTVYTIGYGNRTINGFLHLLRTHNIAYLIDVRSKPYSRFNPDFSRKPLENHLVGAGMRYVFMGDSLGGHPDDPDCYTPEGKVDYDKCKTKPFYRAGIARIEKAWAQDLDVVLMCSELKPQECHRCKLIGETLRECQIDVMHIDERGELRDHLTVMRQLLRETHKLPEGQLSLFGDELSDAPLSLTSRKVYQPKAEPTPSLNLMTIGAHGFTEETFFRALTEAGVQVFYDIRARRGMRGAAYAFANSQRLQKRLAELNIRYVHQSELAPTQRARDLQHAADAQHKVAKRQRVELSEGYLKAYREDCLVNFQVDTFLSDLSTDETSIVLFCVEREPAACHRSIVAQHIAETLNIGVTHLMPDHEESDHRFQNPHDA